MEFVKWALLSLFTTGIGTIVGFGLMTRKVAVAWYHLALIVILIFLFSNVSIFIGNLLRDFLSYRFFEVCVGLIFIAAGALMIYNKPVYPGYQDLIILNAALIIDVGLLSLRYGQLHEGGVGLALTISLFLLGSIVSGMVLGQKRWNNWRITMLMPYVPAIAFILIGIIKVI